LTGADDDGILVETPKESMMTPLETQLLALLSRIEGNAAFSGLDDSIKHEAYQILDKYVDNPESHCILSEKGE
jgi:hypothetical protein